MNNNIENILVVRTDRIGDVVLTTPALTLLRKKFPAARITFLVSSLTKELIDDNPNIDEVLVDDRKGIHKGLGFFALVNELRQRHFDLAVIYHTKKRTNTLCFFAGIPRRLGYKNNKFGFLLTDPIQDERHFGEKHEAQYCLDVLRELGVEGALPQPHINVSNSSRNWVEQILKDAKVSSDALIAIHTGASDHTKCWPIEHFIDVINTMHQKYGCSFVLIGAQNTLAQARQIQEACPEVPVLDLTGATTVGQMAALLSQCRMLISNDSGPVHVADALQVPVISIFTRNQPGINPERWRPLNSQNIALFPPKQGEISFADPQKVNSADMDFLPVSEVLQSVDSLYKLC